MKDKNINDQKNESSKISITTYRNHSDNHNNNSPEFNNNIAVFCDSIPEGINIRNLNARLNTANCKRCFFGGAASKLFRHYIQRTLNETNLKTEIVVLHMKTNIILNTDADKDPVTKSVMILLLNVVSSMLKMCLFEM